jgi:hypothetical protein
MDDTAAVSTRGEGGRDIEEGYAGREGREKGNLGLSSNSAARSEMGSENPESREKASSLHWDRRGAWRQWSERRRIDDTSPIAFDMIVTVIVAPA